MVNGTDVTVTSGSSVVFASPIGISGTDYVDIIAYGTFNVATIAASAITSGTLGYARGGTGLGSLGSADEVLQMNAGGTALEYGKVDTANIADDAVGATQLDVTGNGTSGQMLTSDGDGTFSWADASDPLAYTSVSGTTPSLDVGSYNFFDSGALTGDTTVSFSNIPTQARWTYTVQGAASSSYDLSALAFDTGQTFTSPDAINSYDLDFSDDGSYLYLNHYTSSNIYRYPLSVAWDLTTVGSQDQNPSFSSNTGAFVNFKFGDNGTKLYLAQNATPISIDQYNLSTAWSLTSATYNSTFSVTGQISSTNYTFALKSDGTKFYNGVGNTLYQYSMSTPWSISTSSYDSKSLNLATGTSPTMGGNTLSIDFNSDGTKLFATCIGASDGNYYIYEYSLSTAWDISTASYTSQTQILTAFTNSPYGLKFKPQGDSVFILDYPRTLKRYTTGAVSTLTLPTTVNAPVQSLGTAKAFYEFFTSDGGSNIYLTYEKVI